MIMFGCHFMQGHQQDPVLKQASGWADKKDDSVPFRQVYIHALVRDADRQKMSKTKGNVIDPLDIIQRFGTDATRFTLAAMAAPGTDIAFSESRTDGYRAFANKIWNAARFMFMNVDRAEQAGVWKQQEFLKGLERACPRLAGFKSDDSRRSLDSFALPPRDQRRERRLADLSLPRGREPDLRFLLGRFLRLVYRTDQAAPRCRRTERSKASAGIACGNLVSLFEASLRLLHPVMPFITEEIWHAVYDGKPPLKSIALAAYPQADEKQFDLAAETKMAIVQDLIVSVRNLRAELKVEQKQKVPIQVYTQDAEIKSLLEENHGAIERLAERGECNFRGELVGQAGGRALHGAIRCPRSLRKED